MDSSILLSHNEANGDAATRSEENQVLWKRLLDAAAGRAHDLPASIKLPADGHWETVTELFPMRVNAYFLSLITAPDDPLGRQVIPDPRELADKDGPTDPLAEEHLCPVPQIIHRYPHRVAFLVSSQCALFCRFCMRKRRVGAATQVSRAQIATAMTYIRNQPAINEVVLTGGDPLMLDDDRLLEIVRTLRRMPHVRILRIHTRMPVALPQRLSPELIKGLARCHPLFLNIHVNHPAELTPAAAAACTLMADAGIPLGSQSVLLKGVNDDPDVLAALMEKLLTLRVRPYYLHQLDRVPGTAHFQVPLEKSIDLVNGLRGPLSGMAVPHLMVDLPDGGGKIALAAEAVISKNPRHWLIRNWQGASFRYPVDTGNADEKTGER